MNTPVGSSAPREIRYHRASNELECVWSDGSRSRYRGADLRGACHCAFCVSISSIGRLIDQDARAFLVASVVNVGSYGIQIIFQDGHDRGIYPWVYLRGLPSLDGGS
ncbi:MAG: DUF971 domain-containing protein [Halothiobacillus sp.]